MSRSGEAGPGAAGGAPPTEPGRTTGPAPAARPDGHPPRVSAPRPWPADGGRDTGGDAGPPGRVRRRGPAAGVGRALLAAVQGLALVLLSIVVSLTLFVLTVVSLALMLIGLGFFTTPPLLALVRLHADLRRVLSGQWVDRPVASPYRPYPPGTRRWPAGAVARCGHLLKDPATWRDLLWLLGDAVVGFVTALLPLALLAYAVEGFVLLAGLWSVVRDTGYWYAFILVRDHDDAVRSAWLGAGILLLALLSNRSLIRLHFGFARALLAPTRGALLARRMERLYETRHDAVDTSAAELRRIERDLHDGAQARLVAMGMSLSTAEALIERDPQAARAMLAEAREASAEALTELRDLVRGIHPPVLAERGLGDAVEALALRFRLPVETDIRLPGRFEEPVESAAYFSASEILTNAAKHSGAGQVTVTARHTDEGGGTLRVTVTDDGHGGADTGKGTGMAGIRRRLGPLDGVLLVSSPPGGPTRVTVEIPCAPLPGRRSGH